jgi:hypothetical protein
MQAAEYCMKGGDFKEYGIMYEDYEEFIDLELYCGNHSDEFAEEADDDDENFLKRTRTI